jgi:hypothetical protein
MIQWIRRLLGLDVEQEYDPSEDAEDYQEVPVDFVGNPSFPWAIILPEDDELLPILCDPPELDDFYIDLLGRFQGTACWEGLVLDYLGKKPL